MKTHCFAKTEPLWKVGDLVVLWSDSAKPRGPKEYGRVLRMKWNSSYGWWDVWINFVGYDKPTVEQLRKRKPYVLRYFETSLRSFVPKRKRR